MNAPHVNQCSDITCDLLALSSSQRLSDSIVHPSIPFLRSILNAGEFWKYFTRMSTSKDGHCLVHSLIKSFKSQYCIEYCHKDLLFKIRQETTDFISYYKTLINIGSTLEMQRLLCVHIDAKNYDTPFGDVLPLVLSNVMNM